MIQLLPFPFFFAEPRTLHYLGDEDQFYRSTSHHPFQEKNAKNAGKPRTRGHFNSGFLKLALFGFVSYEPPTGFIFIILFDKTVCIYSGSYPLYAASVDLGGRNWL
jgi:hypothetical protein